MITEVRKDICVTLSDQQNTFANNKINDFIKEMLGKNQSVKYYKTKRNAASLEKIKDDIFIGKKAEYIVALWLRDEYSIPFIHPDFETREGSKKKWCADLSFNGINIHVKSCCRRTFNFCNDFSWTFQYCNNDGKFGKDDLFEDNGKNFVAFVFLETPEAKTGIIKAVLSFENVRSILKDPISKKLVGIKKCVYYNDINIE